MSEGHAARLVRNAAAMVGSQAVTWAAALFVTLYVPRTLGAEGYGQLAFLLALIGILVPLIGLGSNTLITLEVSRDHARAPSHLVNVAALQAATGIIGCGLFIAAAAWMGRSPEVVHAAFILGPGVMIFAAVCFLNAFLQAFEKAHLLAWGSIIEKVLETATIIPLLYLGYRLVPLAGAMVTIGAIQLAFVGYWVHRLVRPRGSLLKPAAVRAAAVRSLPFFSYELCFTIYDQVDIAMLAALAGSVVVGWYSVAYQLFRSLFFVPHIFRTVAFPVLSRLAQADPAAFRRAVHRGFALLSAAAVGVCVPTALLAEPVVYLLFSREFSGAVPVLRILALALALQYLTTMLVMVLQTTDRQGRWARAGAVAAVANPLVNLALIPPLGHLGAAIATVLTEGMLMAMALRACPRGTVDRSDVGVLLRCLAAGGLMAVVLAAGLRLGLVPAVLFGLPIYAAALLRLGVITPADLALLKEYRRWKKAA